MSASVDSSTISTREFVYRESIIYLLVSWFPTCRLGCQHHGPLASLVTTNRITNVYDALVAIMLLMYFILHCLYSVGNKITTATATATTHTTISKLALPRGTSTFLSTTTNVLSGLVLGERHCQSFSERHGVSFTQHNLFADRLGDFIVTVSDIAPSASTHPSSAAGFTECHRYQGIPPESSTVTVLCDVAPIWGRFVTIYLPANEALTICEVQVYEFNSTYNAANLV